VALPHVLIVAARSGGHRLNYVRILAEESLARGDRVSIAIEDSDSSLAHRDLYLAEVSKSAALMEWSDFSPAGVARAADRVKADSVVDPDGDQLAKAIFKNRGWPAEQAITLLIMRPEAQFAPFPGARRATTVVKLLMRRILSRMQGVRVVILVDALTKEPAPNEVPDPIDYRVTAESVVGFRESHGLDGDRFWFAVVGAIDARKNVDLVARAISKLGSRAGLLVAGKVSAEGKASVTAALKLLSQTESRMIVVDRLLSELELDSCVTVADCVVLAHSNEGASGIMGKAAVAGTPMITAGSHSLKRAAAQIPDNAIWVPLTEAGLSEAVANVQSTTAARPVAADARLFAERLLS